MPCSAYTKLELEMMRGRVNSKLLGKEEGDKCNFNGCSGVLEYTESENCSCHISPPCPSCMSVKLHCPECERVID